MPPDIVRTRVFDKKKIHQFKSIASLQEWVGGAQLNNAGL